MTTKDRIIDAALAIANAEGLEALSVRAVAKRLELSPGNVSYHFSKKEDLVVALAERLSEGNEGSLGQPITGLAEYLSLFRTIFKRQHGFRGLILSAPHAIEAYPELRTRYRRAERARKAQVRRQLEALDRAGQLAVDGAELDRLVMHISLISRSWLSEYRLSHHRQPLERVVDHYVGMLASLLAPFATPAGTKELRPFLDRMLDVAPAARRPQELRRPPSSDPC